MSLAQNALAGALIVIGVMVMLVGSIGILRLPDFFSRTHAASMADTIGIVFLLLGLVVFEGFTPEAGKLLIAIALLLLANPVAVHALARAAWYHGERPWVRKEKRQD